MNAKTIGALIGIRDNLTIIINEWEAVSRVTTAEQNAEAKAETAESTTTATPVTKAKSTTTSRKEREASETLPDVFDGLTEEQLNSLSYNNLKKLAKDMGILATGARDELTQKILNAEVSAPAPEVEEEEPVKDEKKSPVKKTPAKVSKNPEPVEEEEEDDEEEEDPIVAKVNEAVADMTNEEIADVLADAGVRAKGKREALISAVIKAVHDGKIDLDDDEESEGEETEDESAEEEGYDVNDTNNPDMTKERKAAIEAHESETRASFDEGDLTRKDMVAWLNEFHGTKDTMKKKSDEDILSEYIYCSCLLINDEGEFPEDEGGAYTVNGIPYCCGHELAFDEENNTYICETCGNEYEAEAED